MFAIILVFILRESVNYGINPSFGQKTKQVKLGYIIVRSKA